MPRSQLNFPGPRPISPLLPSQISKSIPRATSYPLPSTPSPHKCGIRPRTYKLARGTSERIPFLQSRIRRFRSRLTSRMLRRMIRIQRGMSGIMLARMSGFMLMAQDQVSVYVMVASACSQVHQASTSSSSLRWILPDCRQPMPHLHR
jgi:hypothetical protein